MSGGEDETVRRAPGETLESLVDSLIAQIQYAPPKARSLHQRWELPMPLQAFAAPPTDRETWRAWATAGEVWFLIARRLVHGEATPHTSGALQMLFYEMDGRFASSALWLRLDSGQWQLNAATGASSLMRKLDTAILQKLRSSGGM